MKKRILLLCKETFAVPMFYLSEQFEQEGYVTALFHVYPEECLYNKCIYNEITYYAIREKSKSIKYDVKSICEEFISNYKKPIIDDKYLKFIEENYTKYKNLNLQLISSQSSSRYFHYREKFKYTDNNQNRYWLQLCYQKVEQVLNDFQPDYIIDLDSAELIRTIINEVALVKNIPYVNIEYPRYENYIIPTFNMGLKTDKYFAIEYNKNMQLDDVYLQNEMDYVKEYRERSKIMPSMYDGTITAIYAPDKYLKVIKKILRIIMYQINIDLIHRNWHYKRKAKKCFMLTKTTGIIKDWVTYEYLRQKLFRKNKYFAEPCNEVYVYMPLHLIPESTTFVKAPYYISELNLIEQISKSLPIGWFLYVKEHQSMLGERPLSFYKTVMKLPNVKLMQPNYYDDPKPWIVNALGVITITGTSAYEAALLNKKAILFGNVSFEVLTNISRIKNIEELARIIADFSYVNDNIKSCAAYIKTVKKFGYSLDIKYLIAEGYKYLQSDKKPGLEYEKHLENLKAFYINSFSIYEKYYCNCK